MLVGVYPIAKYESKKQGGVRLAFIPEQVRLRCGPAPETLLDTFNKKWYLDKKYCQYHIFMWCINSSRINLPQNTKLNAQINYF